MKKHLKIIFAALAFIILIGLAIKLQFYISGNDKAIPGLRIAMAQALRSLELSKNEGIKLQRALRQFNELLKSLEDALNKLEQGGVAEEVNTEEEENELHGWFGAITKLKDFIKNNPNYSIPEFKYLTDKDWLIVTAGQMETEADCRKALAMLRQKTLVDASKVLRQAISDFSKAHGGNSPQSYEDIKQYLPEDFDKSRYTEVPPDERPSTIADSQKWIIKGVGPVDPIWDTGLWVSVTPYATLIPPINYKQGEMVSAAIEEYKNKNSHAPTSSIQIGEYIKYNGAVGKISETDIDEIFKSLMTPIQ